MSKQTRFGRAFDPWIDRWAELGVTARQMQVLLKLIVTMERKNGEYIASRPRPEISRDLGISDASVRQAIKGLKDLGILKPIGYSHPGWTQRYVVMPKDGAGNGVKIAERMGGYSHPPIEGNGGMDSSQMGGWIHHIWGDEDIPPTRSEEGGAPTKGRARPRL